MASNGIMFLPKFIKSVSQKLKGPKEHGDLIGILYLLNSFAAD
jgi:hypothetical protein